MTYMFRGLEPITHRIEAIAGNIAYIVLIDRTHARKNPRVGRFELTVSNIVGYLESQCHKRSFTDDEDEPDEESAYDFDTLLNSAHQLWAEAQPLTPRIIASVSTSWIKEATARHAFGERRRRMRVKLMEEGGHRMLESATFYYEDPTIHEDTAVVVAEPVVDADAQTGLGSAYRELGKSYSQFAKLLLDSSTQWQMISSSTIGTLNRQLQDTRCQNEQLLATLLNAQVQHLENEREHDSANHELEQRHQLAHVALQQLGEVANVFMMSKGMPPALRKLLGPIAENPKLIEILGAPKTQALLRDSDSVDKLAQILNAIPMPGSEQEAPIEGTYEEEE